MALPQLSPSSSSRSMDNDSPLEHRINMIDFITQLCDIANISVEGYDISSQSFGDRLVDYFREKMGMWNKGRKSKQGILDTHARRTPFRERARIAPTASHSNGHSSNTSESSELPQNEQTQEDSTEHDLNLRPVLSPSIVSVAISPRPSPEVISIASTPQYSDSPNPSSTPSYVASATARADNPSATETAIKQDCHANHDSGITAPTSSPTLPARLIVSHK